MDVTAIHNDVVERRNLVHDAEHHAPYDGKGQKETDRSDKQPPPRTVRDVLVQKRTQTGATERKKQRRHRRCKNRQKNPIAAHGPLNREWDAVVILVRRSPSWCHRSSEPKKTSAPCHHLRHLSFRSQVYRRGIRFLRAANSRFLARQSRASE